MLYHFANHHWTKGPWSQPLNVTHCPCFSLLSDEAAKCYDQHVCKSLSVCLSVCLLLAYLTTYPNLIKHWAVAVAQSSDRSTMHCGWRTVFTWWPGIVMQLECMLKAICQWAAHGESFVSVIVFLSTAKECIFIVIPTKAFARDYIITGVGLFVCLFVTTITK